MHRKCMWNSLAPLNVILVVCYSSGFFVWYSAARTSLQYPRNVVLHAVVLSVHAQQRAIQGRSIVARVVYLHGNRCAIPTLTKREFKP